MKDHVAALQISDMGTFLSKAIDVDCDLIK